jgi:hypothetical protein
MRRFPPARPHAAHVLLTTAALLALTACRPDPPPVGPTPLARAPVTENLTLFVPAPVGDPVDGIPWIPHVNTADLDRDGRMDILACDAQKNEVLWLRQNTPGAFTEIVLAREMRGPVHVDTADLDGDGDFDVLVASMGMLFPNNDRIGTVFVLENDGRQNFAPRILLDHTARVTDVRAGDLNGDGRLDLAVAQFGYDQGEISWMEQTSPWQFRSHPLLDLAGTINVCVADMNGDRALDVVALVSQQWEEIHLFSNRGGGTFAKKVIFGSTNQDFGSSGISLADVNRDGRPDVVYSNGDGFDMAPRKWHGVQWLENMGDDSFRQHRIADLPGAYSPLACDADDDGDIDIFAVSGFNDWQDPRAVSLMLYRNDGRQNFAPVILAHEPTHLMTLATGDLDGSGRLSLVTGSLHAFPPYDRLNRITVWRRSVTP